MENEFSFKDLEEVTIKTTSDMEINGKNIEKGETLAIFDRIQISNFSKSATYVTAHGGYGDRNLVWWKTSDEIEFNFQKGIFSNEQFALMNNGKILEFGESIPIYLNTREFLESNENGELSITNLPYDFLFVYKKNNGEKIKNFQLSGKNLTNLEAYTDYIIDYNKQYISSGKIVTIGSEMIQGYLTLQGKTRVKDDVSGIVRTGIITIPKLKLMSGMSMQLGENAIPVIGRFSAKALPVGAYGNNRIMEIAFLDDYIDDDF